jgi:Uma2 family endonuclease
VTVTESEKKPPESTEASDGDDLDSPFMSLLLTEAPTEEPVYRVSVDQFDRMVEAGVFPPESRVELINGVLVEMSPIGVGHGFVVLKLDRLLQHHLYDRAVIGVQGSFRCGDLSEPEPDLIVVRGPDERYSKRHPRADDALLVIEVADSSLRYDQKVKVPLYGGLGVPEVWVVDLPHWRVHVYTDPKDHGYATKTVRTSEDVLVPTAFPDVEIAVSELLDPLR